MCGNFMFFCGFFVGVFLCLGIAIVILLSKIFHQIDKRFDDLDNLF